MRLVPLGSWCCTPYGMQPAPTALAASVKCLLSVRLYRNNHNRGMKWAVKKTLCLHLISGKGKNIGQRETFSPPLSTPAKIIQILGTTPSLKINIYICSFILFPRELFWSGLLSQHLPCSPYFSCVQRVFSCKLPEQQHPRGEEEIVFSGSGIRTGHQQVLSKGLILSYSFPHFTCPCPVWMRYFEASPALSIGR